MVQVWYAVVPVPVLMVNLNNCTAPVPGTVARYGNIIKTIITNIQITCLCAAAWFPNSRDPENCVTDAPGCMDPTLF